MKRKFTFLMAALALLTLFILPTTGWANEGDELAICQGTGSGYGTRRTLTDSHNVGWVLATGQSGYLGANNDSNHNKVMPTDADLPVVKAVKSDATTSTTGYYFYYTTTAVANVGSIEFSYTANSGNQNATAYVVVGDAVSASGGDAYEIIELSSTSTTAQNTSLSTSGTFTYTFDETQTDERFYGFIIVTSSYKRLTSGIIKLLEGATGATPTCATPTFSPAEGAVLSGTEISISSTDGATIYYTTDGTTPTTSSAVYTNPIEITAAITIKAFATKDNYNDSEIATAEYTIKASVTGYNIDFESDLDCYVDWEFDNALIHSNISGVTAHGGSAWATNANSSGNGVSTASFQTKTKVAYPDVFTCYVSKESNNTSASSWKIQVSEDGSSWTDVATQDATSMDKGVWVEFSASIKNAGHTNMYVRLYYTGSTALRAVDDISLTTYTPAAVEAPSIIVTSPFTISTTVTMNCITDGATIYYTTDGNDPTSSSTEYTNAFTINATTTIKAIAIKGSDESAITEVTATKELATANVTIGSTSINVGASTTVTTDGPAVTLSTGDASIASVDGTTVTGVAAGSTTITANWSANSDYAAGSQEFTVTVVDPNAPGSENNPYTVEEALVVINALDDNGTISNQYVKGIISQVDSYNSTYHSITYWISDDGSTTSQLQVYSGKGLNGADFSATTDLTVGDGVVINGTLKKYVKNENTTPEFDKNSEIKHRAGKPAFTPAQGEVTPGTTVAITSTEDATIYYTTDNSIPTTSSSVYSAPIEINATTTIKAIAMKGGQSSVVATAEYTVNNASTITLNTYSINATAAETDAVITVNYTNVDFTNNPEIVWYESDGTTSATYNWIQAEINNEHNVYYIIGANTGDARTAYFKVYGLSTGGDDVYSNLVTVSQAAYVAPLTSGTGTITFGSGTDNTAINGTSVTGNDNLSNEWTITTVFGDAGSSFTQNASYSQVGASKKPATSITFTMTLPNAATISAFEAKFGGFNGTEGTITLKIGENTVGTGTLNGTDDVTVSTLPMVTGTALTVTVTDIAKGVKCYYISYTLGTQTYTLSNINGYTNDNTKDGYYLIATPVSVDPANVTGLTSGDFDLYYYDDSQELQWRNYEAAPFNMVPGKGYLYAKKSTTETSTYSFTLTGAPYSGNGVITVAEGWNLIGNPFASTATIPNDQDYCILNDDRNELMAGTSHSIAAMGGIFVEASAAGTVTFTEQSRGQKNTVNNWVVLNLNGNHGIVDRAIVRFGEGKEMSKFQLNPNSTKLYFTEDNKDYAIVRGNAQGELPVNFKAATDGTYTINVETENLDVNYLHLIDNKTGMDIDLMATPTYTFEGKRTDYASRFRLVFNANSGNNEISDNFAFMSDGNLIVNGEGTLQVVDMLGRVVFTSEVNSSLLTPHSSLTPGVYVLRLVNGNNVKTQKIVIK